MDLIRNIRERDPNAIIFVITGYPSMKYVSESLTLRAYEYFVKPFNLGEMHVKIQRAFEKRQLEKKIKTLQRLLLVLFISIPLWIALTVLLQK